MATPRRRANSREDVGQFTRRDAGRIAAATVAYEQGNRNRKPVKFNTQTPAGCQVRLTETELEWRKGSVARLQITTMNILGVVEGTGEYFEAKNEFADIKANKTVMCVSLFGTWYLIAAEC
jgi:hypothetical protein